MQTREAKRLFKRVFRIAIQEKSEILDEAAFPAYSHRNPIIDHVFWGRLDVVERYLRGRRPSKILDFGCGSGVMSYILSDIAEQIVATDIEPAAFQQMQREIRFPDKVHFVAASELAEERYSETFDAIVALDVLEHVYDLGAILRQFQTMLRPGGIVVISGPTENILYKLGRRIAGDRFTGDYHVSDIGKIENKCRTVGRVEPIATLLFFLPLFKVFSLQFEIRD